MTEDQDHVCISCATCLQEDGPYFNNCHGYLLPRKDCLMGGWLMGGVGVVVIMAMF